MDTPRVGGRTGFGGKVIGVFRDEDSMRQRFFAKVLKGDTCWAWVGSKSEFGYGSFYAIRASDGKKIRTSAHKFSYYIATGDIRWGRFWQIDHLCNNPNCVNPEHLELVTARENSLRSNSMSGRRARQTHCKHGHEFTEENTMRFPSSPNSRHCARCQINRRKGGNA